MVEEEEKGDANGANRRRRRSIIFSLRRVNTNRNELTEKSFCGRTAKICDSGEEEEPRTERML